MLPTRTYEPNSLTRTLVDALKTAIHDAKDLKDSDAECKARYDEFVNLLNRIQKEHLDLRMSSRLE